VWRKVIKMCKKTKSPVRIKRARVNTKTNIPSTEVSRQAVWGKGTVEERIRLPTVVENPEKTKGASSFRKRAEKGPPDRHAGRKEDSGESEMKAICHSPA